MSPMKWGYPFDYMLVHVNECHCLSRNEAVAELSENGIME